MTDQTGESASRRAIIDYRMIWRWHFYAGLVCIPFILVLCFTGPIYLFKPQIETWIDRKYDGLPFVGPAKPVAAQVEAALSVVPGGQLQAIEVRPEPHDALRVLVQKNGEVTRVFVHPQSLTILKQVPEKSRFMEVVKTVHGELLSGRAGQVVVEGAASWAIVMIISGLYLWWPRGAQGAAGVLLPRLTGGKRLFWRDLHAVTGVYVSALALCLLLTGLPWTYVWGNGLKAARKLGSPPAEQAWSTGRADEKHHDMMNAGGTADLSRIDGLVAVAHAENLAPPVLLNVPTKHQHLWKLDSQSGNRVNRVTLMLHPDTYTVADRSAFADKKPLDKVVGVGISLHEGQLFGPLNQALGVITALGLMTLCVSAVVMWWQRRASGSLGTPDRLPDERLGLGLTAIIIGLGIFLPVLGVSLIVMGLTEALILRHIAPAAAWLGLR